MAAQPRDRPGLVTLQALTHDRADEYGRLIAWNFRGAGGGAMTEDITAVRLRLAQIVAQAETDEAFVF